MCGISGIINLNSNFSYLHNKNNIVFMTNALNHRGPDSKNFWISECKKIFLGHNRLSIQDLSDKANQPMESATSRYVVVYNGEIYNHKELRIRIDNHKKIIWKSSSDTESMINYIEIFGFDDFFKKARGMFAFALFDKKENKIFLVRDRFGEKPLYYGYFDDQLVFSSELKSFMKIYSNLELNLSSIKCFLQLSYIPAPQTIFKKIHKLNQASILEINLNNKICNHKISKWWSVENEIKESKKKLIFDQDKALVEFEKKLFSVVKEQLISDVPVGCFLSGGIDSTVIAHTMSHLSKSKIETFSIGFNNFDYDESLISKKTSKNLNANHNELIIESKDCLQVIENISEYYDEPFADSSQIPTILLSNFAKKKVTVVLTGDGGDEVFAGYNRYFLIEKIWNIVSKFPYTSRKYLCSILDLFPNSVLKKLIVYFAGEKTLLEEKIKKTLLAIKRSKNIDDFYKNILTVMNSELLINDCIFFNSIDENYNFSKKEQMMINDYKNYLSDDILCKVDRASMASSLETRIPFLDIDIFKFAWTLPMEMKILNYSQKIFLKNYLKKVFPDYSIDQAKRGFSVPISLWLRKDFNYLIEEILLDNKIKNLGIFDQEKTIKLWKEFKLNKNSFSGHLFWNIYVLFSWIEKYKKNIKIL